MPVTLRVAILSRYIMLMKRLRNLFLSVLADSLRYTSALAVALAIVFLVITAGIVVTKLFYGGISMPRLLPNMSDIASVWNLFTVVPVLVTAFICHFNGMVS